MSPSKQAAIAAPAAKGSCAPSWARAGKAVAVIASGDGLLVHVGRATADGFQTLEVWESEEHYDRANSAIVLPVLRELADDQPLRSMHQTAEVFEVHGLVVPAATSSSSRMRRVSQPGERTTPESGSHAQPAAQLWALSPMRMARSWPCS
jgi:hypothetical protein